MINDMVIETYLKGVISDALQSGLASNTVTNGVILNNLFKH